VGGGSRWAGLLRTEASAVHFLNREPLLGGIQEYIEFVKYERVLTSPGCHASPRCRFFTRFGPTTDRRSPQCQQPVSNIAVLVLIWPPSSLLCPNPFVATVDPRIESAGIYSGRGVPAASHYDDLVPRNKVFRAVDTGSGPLRADPFRSEIPSFSLRNRLRN
jgi:hypothetical protein